MLDKFFSFLGFNSGEALVGLSGLTDNINEKIIKPVKNNKKDLKLSDLMRGN